jgi:hypothetical protein
MCSIKNVFRGKTLIQPAIGCVVISLLLCTPTFPASDSSTQTASQTYISILRTLDFTKVGLSVKTQPQFQEALRARALARLQKSGLEPVKLSYKGPVQALLVLTLDPIPGSDGSPDKVLYDKKIELRDDVIIKRDLGLHLEAVTWSFGPSHPQLVPTVALEALLADVDLYIDQFIVSYGLPRPQ